MENVSTISFKLMFSITLNKEQNNTLVERD